VRIALTIDTELAGHVSKPGNSTRQLDALAAAGVPATFFVQGRWAGACPQLARRIVADGHLLGNHSYHHAPLAMMTEVGIRHTVQRAEETLTKITGIDPRPWFRCPYGDGEDDPRVLGVLAELGYRNVGWDVAPEDWTDERDADDLVETIVAGAVACGDGARVLLHSWPDVTAATLPRIIARLREAGAELVRVDELEG
jgi:peptidoglycan/xylan/chitin deacetylase (PgdA/CDA1 family)